LYAAPGALLPYAVFGSSRHLVVGPMAATAALSAAAVEDVAAGDSGVFPDLTVTMALTVGVLALTAGLLRLGFVATFNSEPVLKGFQWLAVVVGLGSLAIVLALRRVAPRVPAPLAGIIAVAAAALWSAV
jgi:SulP family sulfate permease